MTLQNRVVLITGACGDIGREIALLMGKERARLVLNDVVPDAHAEPLVAEIGRLGGEAIYYRADVADRKCVDAMIDKAGARFGPLDICIGNAAIVEVSPFLDMTADSWARHIDINLTGCFHVAQQAARAMVRAGKGGSIILISSWVQDVPSENISAYCVAKSGLKMLARSMALELGRHNITVNLVAPGFVDAGLSGRLFREKPGLKKSCAQYVPLGYIASAADVAAAVMLLSMPAARYMTGSTLLVDGGNSLFLRGGNA
jgi:glucose 1-dehydrogenase